MVSVYILVSSVGREFLAACFSQRYLSVRLPCDGMIDISLWTWVGQVMKYMIDLHTIIRASDSGEYTLR
jgi:hypothetical protein